MAATAATAISSSSFSTSMQSLNPIRSKTMHNYSDHSIIKITPKNMSHFSSISHSLLIQSILVSQKCRPRRIMAAVAQEEAALTAETETQEVVEEEEVAESVEIKEEGEEASVVDEAPVTLNTKLYFGNLPYLCDSAQLAGIIQDYGSPELVEVLYDRETGRSRGFAFVTMSTIEDCQAIIDNLDGREFGGRTLRVNFADKPKPKEPLYPETEHKLFVGNLSWTVTSESLTKVFQEYGNVVGARVLYDGETGRSRGYGFVCFPTKSEMEAALQSLDGVELEGRPIRVSLAQGKRQ